MVAKTKQSLEIRILEFLQLNPQCSFSDLNKHVKGKKTDKIIQLRELVHKKMIFMISSKIDGPKLIYNLEKKI